MRPVLSIPPTRCFSRLMNKPCYISSLTFFFKLSVNPGLIIKAIVFNSNIWNYFILDPQLFFFSLYYVFYRSRDIHLSEHTNLRNLDYNQYF